MPWRAGESPAPGAVLKTPRSIRGKRRGALWLLLPPPAATPPRRQTSRQLFLGGEGDGDAATFVLGMFAGAAFAHNFGLASSPQGVGPYGPAAVVIGLAFCLCIGWTMREKTA